MPSFQIWASVSPRDFTGCGLCPLSSWHPVGCSAGRPYSRLCHSPSEGVSMPDTRPDTLPSEASPRAGSLAYKLSPSDLTYLFDGCKHCFVLKVRYGVPQPSIRMPGIFGTIAGIQKNYYSGKRTEDFCPQLPPGRVEYGEKWIRSTNITPEGCTGSCFINGRFDIVARFDDMTYAVMDFKTANPTEEKSELYGRQLHAYAYALENPAQGALRLAPVSRLGLIYFSPTSCALVNSTRQMLEGQIQWVEISRSDGGFMNFLAEVVRVLEGPLPEPQMCTHCPHCCSQRLCEVAKEDRRCANCICSCCPWCVYRMRTSLGNTEGIPVSELTPLQYTGPHCPVCGGRMTIRPSRRGEFWSCKAYPRCNGSRNAEEQ